MAATGTESHVIGSKGNKSKVGRACSGLPKMGGSTNITKGSCTSEVSDANKKTKCLKKCRTQVSKDCIAG